MSRERLEQHHQIIAAVRRDTGEIARGATPLAAAQLIRADKMLRGACDLIRSAARGTPAGVVIIDHAPVRAVRH